MERLVRQRREKQLTDSSTVLYHAILV